jgi:CubicO group peptidase (beta-lactamase class C family)
MDYVLLGMIIEKATGSSISSQLTDRFFEPLGLEHTLLYPEQVYPIDTMAHMWWDASGTGEPVDVVEGAGELPLASLWSALWVSCAIHSTAEDLARFTKDLFEGRAIQQDALEKMLTPGPEIDSDVYYGYSVIIERIDGKTVYWHPGGAGYSSVYFYVPEDGISIAVLGNLMVDLKPVAVALYEAYVEHQK